MKIRYKFNLISYLMNLQYIHTIDDLIIPKKEDWVSFYKQCKENNNFNIACIGPHDSCKTTMIELIIQEFTRDHKDIHKDKIIYKLNTLDDVALQQTPNVLSIFCQNYVACDKIVYIEIFDDLTEQKQQELKQLMDKYYYFKEGYKVHFIIESTNDHKIKDHLKSRFQFFYTTLLKKDQLFDILKKASRHHSIEVDDSCLSFIKQKHNISITPLLLFIEKMILLDISYVSYMSFHTYYQCFDDSLFSSYFGYIEESNMKEANDLLFQMFNDGYDLSDILFFLYSYAKYHNMYYYSIEIICYYINEYYNGNYHKLLIIFLTFEIQKKKESLM